MVDMGLDIVALDLAAKHLAIREVENLRKRKARAIHQAAWCGRDLTSSDCLC